MKSEKQEKFGSKIKTLSVTLLKYFQSNIYLCHIGRSNKARSLM